MLRPSNSNEPLDAWHSGRSSFSKEDRALPSAANDTLCYDAPCKLPFVGKSNEIRLHSTHSNRIAVSSFISSSYNNRIQIIEASTSSSADLEADEHRRGDGYGHDPEATYRPSSARRHLMSPASTSDFTLRATANHPYPPTRLEFEPVPYDQGGSASSSSASSGSTTSSSSSNASSPATGSRMHSIQGGAGGRIGSLGYEQGRKSVELLASSGDVLRIWEITEGDGQDDDDEVDQGDDDDDTAFNDSHRAWAGSASSGYQYGANDQNHRYRHSQANFINRKGTSRAKGYHGFSGADDERQTSCKIREKSRLTNSKAPVNSLPPLTSLSWNAFSPSHIVTSSVDTTCSIFDLNTSTAITQLIAHDKAVYDVSWLPFSSDVFTSVGADGSLRAFDLRSLEHSTILYETPDNRPLARISFSSKEQHYLTTFGIGDRKAVVLDMRSPGTPVAELRGHERASRGGGISAIAWGCEGRGQPGGGGWIATAGDDSQLLLYDLTHPLPFPSSSEANSAAPSTTASSAASPERGAGSSRMDSSSRGWSDMDSSRSSKSTAASTPALNGCEKMGGGGNNKLQASSTKAQSSAQSSPGTVQKWPTYGFSTDDNGSEVPGGHIPHGFGTGGEIVNLAWSRDDGLRRDSDGGGSWIGCISGKRLTCLRF